MKLKMMKKALIPASIATAAFSGYLNAATENYAVGFSTVPDITITEVTALDFGNGLGLASGSTCVMVGDSTAGTYIGDPTMNLSQDTPVAAGGNHGDTTCATGVNDSGTVGVYEVIGVPGGTVSITVNDIGSGTAFNFTSTGCAGNYDGLADGDGCTDLTSGAASVQLAAPGDTVGNTGTGNPVSGTTRISVGGTITTQQAHTAGTLLTESFVIDVTY